MMIASARKGVRMEVGGGDDDDDDDDNGKAARLV
jgi:hypothetical protein